jgi:hypothetical protein
MELIEKGKKRGVLTYNEIMDSVIRHLTGSSP